ncbi:hypothetical protein FHY13_003511 [Xanthomonas arboricola]|uniref:hypothetical protein n=1 Tax=Xanthomonas euroxanthea TaxID=2259622 RepID=UPI001609C72D|nr:hypothetical protein [Xanthomonas euroxanthea]MBB3815130.1 hypothetical protein [Xanthomonas euroxanthea]
MRYLLALTTLLPGAALAGEATGYGKITYVENGWYGEGIALHHSTALITDCTAGPNDFVIDRNHAAYQELLAMALTAYTRDLDVQLIVEKKDCRFGGRTKILAMRFAK